MASQFTKGQAVRQKVTPIEGTVERFDMDPDNGNRLVLVQWSVPGDEPDEVEVKSRWFPETELEAAE